jgi:hypothetical protein
VTRLAFLSPHEADLEPVSPVRATAEPAYTDVSGLGKLEVRGSAPPGALPIGPGRSLYVIDGDVRPERDRLVRAGSSVYDQTAALAAFEISGEDLLRRLTELDPETLPAIGSIARGTPAVIERLDGERFRLFVPQELGQFVGDVIADLARGLGR